MISGPTHPLFACNTQWKCIGGLTPPLGAYVLNGRPLRASPVHKSSQVKNVPMIFLKDALLATHLRLVIY